MARIVTPHGAHRREAWGVLLVANTGDTPRAFILAPALAALPPVEYREWLYCAC